MAYFVYDVTSTMASTSFVGRMPRDGRIGDDGAGRTPNKDQVGKDRAEQVHDRLEQGTIRVSHAAGSGAVRSTHARRSAARVRARRIVHRQARAVRGGQGSSSRPLTPSVQGLERHTSDLTFGVGPYRWQITALHNVNPARPGYRAM